MPERITEVLIRHINTDGARRMIADSEVRGFCLRVGTAGDAKYLYRYRLDGQQYTYTIGGPEALTAAQARAEARKLAGMVARGENPAKLKRMRREAATFKELAQDYLEIAQGKRSFRDDVSKIERVLLPAFGKRKVAEINTGDIRGLLARLRRDGLKNSTVNRYRALVSAMFTLAVEHEWIEKNPVARVETFQENNKRDRWLTPEQLATLMVALDAEPANAANCIRMMYFTGQRRGDVMSMRWQDVDIVNRRWRIPRPKSGVSHTIPLNDGAVAILERQRSFRHVGNDHVFPGQKEGSPIRTVQQAWDRAKQRIGLVDFHLHDLRHTFASHAIAKQVDLYTLSKLLGHSDARMTQRYSHLADDALSRASSAAISAVWPSQKEE